MSRCPRAPGNVVQHLHSILVRQMARSAKWQARTYVTRLQDPTPKKHLAWRRLRLVHAHASLLNHHLVQRQTPWLRPPRPSALASVEAPCPRSGGSSSRGRSGPSRTSGQSRRCCRSGVVKATAWAPKSSSAWHRQCSGCVAGGAEGRRRQRQ